MKTLLSKLTTGVIIALSLSQGAAAISSADLHAAIYDTVFYDPNATTCTVQTSINLSGSDNAQKTVNFFMSKGLTGVQASAIAGNFEAESSINPTRNQNGGGPGRGIAQWSVDGRWATLLKFATPRQLDPLALSTQLEFSWREFAEDYGGSLTALKATGNDIVAATTAVMVKYEMPSSDPSVNHIDKRIQFAQNYLAKYGGGTPAGGGTVTSAPAAGCSGITGPGKDTQYIDGFTVYSQYDPAWKDKPYQSGTIGHDGCGPTAMAMIITALTGTPLLPDAAAAYAGSQGLLVGGGSSWQIGPVMAKHYGLKAASVARNVADISVALQAGALIITAGAGPEPFTSGGHFIVIRGITANGMWKVGDSAHANTSAKEWNPNDIIASMAGHEGSIYAITK